MDTPVITDKLLAKQVLFELYEEYFHIRDTNLKNSTLESVAYNESEDYSRYSSIRRDADVYRDNQFWEKWGINWHTYQTMDDAEIDMLIEANRSYEDRLAKAADEIAKKAKQDGKRRP